MLKTHEKFHSTNGKRQILIVDDELINRELLNLVLQDDFETLFATDGRSAIEMVRKNKDTLSLIFLDLLMPGMHGLDVIKILKNDQDLKDIPLIVMTADQEAEVTSLQLGASDFIPKPYPKKEVIITRVVRAIELSEDRDIIQSTERDHLTGLYNREYFYRYAEQFDQHHKGMSMDAIVVDVHHFHMINERYGKAYGDEVLRRIGEKVREMVRDAGGIVCRREADTFLVYCPHRDDYEAILENARIGLSGEEGSDNRVRLRMGVYADVDKSIEMERRFDRAKMASDTVRGAFIRPIAIYDSKLHESEIYAEQLLEDFPSALEQKQFKVFYQPKFDVRPEIPVLTSAEALVRWQHPSLGLISPGLFIPLFEENGLIEQLDRYVWRESAAQIKDWKERFGIAVPVSVNVSRIDIYDPELINILKGLLEEFDLKPGELLLEITESAYTQDSTQIIAMVNELRSLGFKIEMDDFGTGYSSLNMISSLPIDALKLDMKFIRNAFNTDRDTRLIEVIIDIADYLSVPIIAEGVETEEQLNALKSMGCDLVQGYYFSKPVPSHEYEVFIEEKIKVDKEADAAKELIRGLTGESALSFGDAHVLSNGFEVIYYVDLTNGHYVEFTAQGKYDDLQIERSGSDFFSDTQDNIPRVIYEEDRERVKYSLSKDVLISHLSSGQSFSMTYRLLIGNVPTYYNLHAVHASLSDEQHIVIGVSNVADQILQTSALDVVTEKGNAFLSIAQTLSSDLESVYYVDIDTDDYIEFVAQGSYEDLQIELSGKRFFDECRKNIQAVVYSEDQPIVERALSKSVILSILKGQKAFTLVYRLLIDGRPTYYQLKAAMTADGRHLVIGVSNVEARVASETSFLGVSSSDANYSRIYQA
ncbi:MAG: EAL domain-containing protein, partial [Oscillospiraceae bacterium]|nr:EAL domain-containing protein [Oscillospiraceae bacterium]